MFRIRDGVKRTHCGESAFLSELCGCNVYLKKDIKQITGSFKERGGRNALLLLSPEAKRNGVITG